MKLAGAIFKGGRLEIAASSLIRDFSHFSQIIRRAAQPPAPTSWAARDFSHFSHANFAPASPKAPFGCTRLQSGEVLSGAWAAWRGRESSAMLAFSEPRNSALASRILAALAQGPMTQTELHHLHGRHLKSSELNNALADLQARGLVVSQQSGGGPAQGRPRSTCQLSAGATNNHTKQGVLA